MPADLLALAEAADAGNAAAPVLPGQADQAAATAQREAAELTALLCLAVKAGGYVEPALPRYYTEQACADISAAYLECAAKYGWTWHQSIAAGPELKLAGAVAIPAFLVYQERTERLKAQARAASRPANVTPLHPAPAPAPATDGG